MQEIQITRRMGSIKTTAEDLHLLPPKKAPTPITLKPKRVIKHELESDEVARLKEPEGPEEKELRQMDEKIEQQYKQVQALDAVNSSLFQKSISFQQMVDNTLKKSKEMNRLRVIKNLRQLSDQKTKLKISRKVEQMELETLAESQLLRVKLEELNSYHQAILQNTQRVKQEQVVQQRLYEEAIQNHMRLQQQYQTQILARNSVREKARTLEIQQRELALCQNDSSLQVAILAIQTNKKIRFSFTTSDYQQAYKNILNCTAWKHKSKHVFYLEMKFYLISRLFPGMADIAAKWTVNSQIYPFMFMNKAGPVGSQIDKLDRKIFQDVGTRKTAKVDRRKIFVAFGHTDGNPVEDFKNNLKRDLTNYQGYLLHIKGVEFSRVNSVVELITIQYAFDEKPATRIFYLIDIGDRPNAQTITSLVQKNKVTQISSFLTETIGNQRTGFISVKIPRHFPPEDEKTYLEMYEVMRRDK